MIISGSSRTSTPTSMRTFIKSNMIGYMQKTGGFAVLPFIINYFSSSSKQS